MTQAVTHWVVDPTTPPKDRKMPGSIWRQERIYKAACGEIVFHDSGSAGVGTFKVPEVTCGRCLRSRAFKTAKEISP